MPITVVIIKMLWIIYSSII